MAKISKEGFVKWLINAGKKEFHIKKGFVGFLNGFSCLKRSFEESKRKYEFIKYI